MLDLYHAEPTGASGRVLIALLEKGLEFHGHHVDVLALEQYRPPLRQLEPSGEIPILASDGALYTGATPICELLEEVFPDRPPLMPAGARDRWAVRVWQKYVDDVVAPCVGELAWEAFGARSMPPSDREGLAEAIERLVPLDDRGRWRAALAGYGAERLARARGRVEEALGRVEAALAESTWLAGPAYSLADIAVFAYFKYLPQLAADRVNESAAPRTLQWLRAISERSAVCSALASGRAADPFGTAIPAPEQIRWG